MNLSPRAKKTARTLLRANRKSGISWRHISQHGYISADVVVEPGINHGTICRFAKARGSWIPAGVELQKAFGIYRERKQPAKTLIDMSRDELLYVLNNRKPLIATHTKKAMDEFIRACNSASKARKARATS